MGNEQEFIMAYKERRAGFLPEPGGGSMDQPAAFIAAAQLLDAAIGESEARMMDAPNKGKK